MCSERTSFSNVCTMLASVSGSNALVASSSKSRLAALDQSINQKNQDKYLG